MLLLAGRSPRRISVAALVAVLATLGLSAPALAADTGTIAGRYTTADGAPIAQAFVHVYNADPLSSVAYGSTDSSGNYSVSVPAGSYRLEFTHQEHATQWAHGKLSPFSADVYVVTGNATTTVNEVALATGRITGVVTDPSGAPVEQAEVRAYAEDGGNTVYATAFSGRYTMNVPAGRYRIGVAPYNAFGLQQFVPGRTNQSDGTVFTVADGATVTVDEQLLPPGTVTGTVSAADGSPLAGASVQVLRPEGLSVAYTTADSAGRFSAKVLPGDYRITFTTADYSRSQYFVGAKTLDTATTYTVGAGATLDVADRLLPAGNLRVTARNAITGAAIPDLCANAGNRGECSGGSGQVVLTDIPAGETTVSVSDSTGAHFQGEVTVQTPAGGTLDVTLSLQPAAVIETVVRDAATGAPVPSACVAVVPVGEASIGGEGFNACSDSTGKVRIGYLQPGLKSLFVLPEEGSGYGAQWVGPNGGTGDQRLGRKVKAVTNRTVTVPDIRLDRAGTVTGQVFTAPGVPATNGTVSPVTWQPGSGSSIGAVDVGADGRYTIGTLGPYAWPLLFVTNERPRQWSGGVANRHNAQRIAVTAGGRTTYDITLAAGATITGTAPADYGWVIGRNAVTGDIMGVAYVENGRYTMSVVGPQALRIGTIAVAVPRSGTKTVNIP